MDSLIKRMELSPQDKQDCVGHTPKVLGDDLSALVDVVAKMQLRKALTVLGYDLAKYVGFGRMHDATSSSRLAEVAIRRLMVEAHLEPWPTSPGDGSEDG